jgi:PHP family Zn ribbon phosphoesterase
MKLAYDLHLHSCLSPCGDMDMTPYNLVNMAKLLGFDIIALTDHNTCGNCAAAIKAGEEAGLVVVPGMELCTAEEIHTVCLFPDLVSAEAFSAYIYSTLPPIQNDPAVYGRQVKMDHLDNEVGEEPLLLVLASGVSISDVPALVQQYGGACYPAHIDRASYSVISQLGTIDETMGFRCAEISDRGDPAALAAKYPALQPMRVIRSSDAHYLENMREPVDFLHPEECTARALIEQLNERRGTPC